MSAFMLSASPAALAAPRGAAASSSRMARSPVALCAAGAGASRLRFGAGVAPASRPSLRRAARRAAPAPRAVAVPAPAAGEAPEAAAPAAPAWATDYSDVRLSGLQGAALRWPATLPSKAEVLAAIPAHCFKRDTARSMKYALISVALTLGTAVAAALLLPLQAAWAPAWVAYALVNGTIATGAWVVAHECGHNAFSDNRTLQDAVGYVLHSALLVPYFSWQRSHAVHHARTNHVTEGETHCPYPVDSASGRATLAVRGALGEAPFAAVQLFTHLAVGWPAYLLWGATGGSSRGVTNHFWPVAPFSDKLWPGSWKGKVWKSDVGVLAVLAGLVAWAASAGSAAPVLALYVGPYLVTNAWLVLYTWLQHTDVDVPHYEGADWSFVKGAFLTVDRPYGPLFDFLHHRIGSTHVAHHVESSIPHYHALEATHALKAAFPALYLYDPTPVWKALFRVAAKCVAVVKRGDKYIFVASPAEARQFAPA
jgi:omega-6 fatty acid desaturase (delta-12 desaturase)